MSVIINHSPAVMAEILPIRRKTLHNQSINQPQPWKCIINMFILDFIGHLRKRKQFCKTNLLFVSFTDFDFKNQN